MLDDLIARGRAIGQEGAYRLTEAGRAVRDEAEAATDRAFFASWACLNDAELVELRRLLAACRDGLAM